MTTLAAYAAFLTARWDELEAASHSSSARRHQGVTTIDMLRDDLAAKRAILDEVARGIEWWERSCQAGCYSQFTNILQHLAAPFRDHPDHPANQEA